jgi:M6 family metalloprotease-like protein
MKSPAIRFLLSAAVVALSAFCANAAFIRDYAVSLQQPDGSKVTVYLTGDEFFSTAATADGYTVLRHPDTGWIVYADRKGDDLVPTNRVVGTTNPALLGLKPRLAPSSSRLLEIRTEGAREMGRFYGKTSKNKGTMTNIIVFIRFSDEPDTVFSQPVTAYEGMLNGTPGTNSLRNYYLEASYGALTINSSFFPAPAGTVVVSYQDSHPRSYYQPYNSSTNPNGYREEERAERELSLITAATAAVEPAVTAMGADLDIDDNGMVDSIAYVASGDPTAWATLLWPHAWWHNESITTLAGLGIDRFSFQLANYLTSRGVGVLCHEMFHVLGAPDLYHYSSDGLHPVGAWDLMEYDRNPPQHMLTHMKWKYGNWLDSIPEITTAGRYTLNPATSPSGNAFKIKSANSANEYFVLEYRRKAGVFESSIPDTGLIVYRVNPLLDGNAVGPPDEVYIYRPDGTTKQDGLHNSAFFSAESGRTAINDTTNPSSFLNDGALGYLDISGISSAGSTISFDVKFTTPPAEKLAFVWQPGPGKPGQAFSEQPEVVVQTSGGLLVPGYSGSVTLSITPATGTPGAVLNGTKTVSLLNGRATFNGLGIDRIGSGFTLTATCAGVTDTASAAFSVTDTGVETIRPNVSSTQREAGMPWSTDVSINRSGTHCTFTSAVNNLVAGDTNGCNDTFIRDLSTGVIERVSVSTAGVEGNNNSGSSSTVPSGRFVVFDSWADNLVSGDTNNALDVFLRDRQTGTTTRVSLTYAGGQANKSSYAGAVSDDGRYVAFQSEATNLVIGDTNARQDIFVRDTVAGTTERISVSSTGTQGNNNSYRHVTMSADGNLVAFVSYASNLVANDTNGTSDVFIHNRTTKTTECFSVNPSGNPGNGQSECPSISEDGTHAVFASVAGDLVSGDTNNRWDIFLRNRGTGITTKISSNYSGGSLNNNCYNPDITPDLRYICYDSYATTVVPNDTNLFRDVFIHDRTLNTTARVNVSATGHQSERYSDCWTAGHSIGAGPKVTFYSEGSVLVPDDTNGMSDVFVKEIATNTLTRLSSGPGNYEAGGGWSENPTISDNGRYVVFQSPCSTLVADDTNQKTDCFLRDLKTGATERVSITNPGGQSNSDSADPVVNADGSVVAFSSNASNLVHGGDGTYQQIYVRDRNLNQTICVSATFEAYGNGDSIRPAVSADGNCIAFVSWATNLGPADTNGQPDVYWVNRTTGEIKLVSVATSGAQANGSQDVYLYPAVSADGRFVAFCSYASNLTANDTNGAPDIFVYDTQTGVQECVSVDPAGKPGNATSWWADMSDDGRFVVFMSDASNLISGDTNGQADIYVRDRALGRTTRVSVGAGGVQSTGNSRDPAISSTGRFVIFKSSDGNLVAGDTNGQWDVFVYDMVSQTTKCVSMNDSQAMGNGESTLRGGISANGQWAVYRSWSDNLVPNDANTAWDIFAHGPMSWTPAKYMMADMKKTLRIAAGLQTPSLSDAYWLDVNRHGLSSGRIDISDAALITRKVTGLDTNP